MRSPWPSLIAAMLVTASPASYAQDPELACIRRLVELATESMKGLKEGAPVRKGRIDECALATRELKTYQDVAAKFSAEVESCRNSKEGKKFDATLKKRIKDYDRDRKRHCR
jgi:hypothetical protein